MVTARPRPPVVTTRLRPTSGGKCSHGSPETSRSHDSPEGASSDSPVRPRLAAYFQLARGHLSRLLQKVTNSVDQLHRPTLCGGPTDQLSNDHNSLEGVYGDCPMRPRQSRPTPGGRCSHDPSEGNPGLERHLRLARGQPRVGDAVMTRSTGDAIMTRLRPTSDGKHSHES
jgi:hypothetical protein